MPSPPIQIRLRAPIRSVVNEPQRAALYRGLARLIEAGLTREAVYETLRTGHRSRPVLCAIATLEAAQCEGAALSEAMERASPEIPRADALFIRSAEPSGEVPEALRELADAQKKRLRARRDPLARAVYAICLLHMAVVAANSGTLYTQPLAGLTELALVLVPFDALLFLGWLAVAHPPRSAAPALLMCFLPGLGGVITTSSYRAYFSSLQRLYSAGVPLALAATEALGAIGNAGFRERVAIAIKPLDYGKPLGDVLARLPRLDSQALAMLASSEPVGELDGALLQAAAMYGELEIARRTRLAHAVAALLYTAVALYIATRLILFYVTHFAGASFGSL